MHQTTKRPNTNHRDVMDESQLISLVRRAQRGDRSAFGELAAAYQSAVFAIVLR